MSSGGGGQNTNTQVQQIPAYEQQFSQENQDLARSISSQAYPTYQGQLIAGQNSAQQSGQGLAMAAGTNWQGPFRAAEDTTQNALTGQNAQNFNTIIGQGQGATQAGQNANPFIGQAGAANNATQQAQALTDPNAVGRYMNPFVEQALAPQVQDLNLQLASQQQGINSQAAQAGAYGDARQGAMAALQNLYGNQAMNQLIGTGYNNAYTQALQALGQAQGTQLGAAGQYNTTGGQMEQQQALQLQAGQQYGQFAGLENQQQNTQLQGGQLEAALANQQQQQTIAGANAQYNVGQQLQTQQQNELNSAYQQYLNQVNWPFQMLNVREGALSNSPYNIQTATTLPNANSTAQGFGTLASAAGLLGSLGGSGGGAGAAPFGGARVQ